MVPEGPELVVPAMVAGPFLHQVEIFSLIKF
jgi:hypothetical protein